MKYFLAILALTAASPAYSQAIVIGTCGSVNYTASIGYQHQLTMNPQGYLCVSSTTLGATEETKQPPVKDEPPKEEKAK